VGWGGGVVAQWGTDWGVGGDSKHTVAAVDVTEDGWRLQLHSPVLPPHVVCCPGSCRPCCPLSCVFSFRRSPCSHTCVANPLPLPPCAPEPPSWCWFSLCLSVCGGDVQRGKGFAKRARLHTSSSSHPTAAAAAGADAAITAAALAAAVAAPASPGQTLTGAAGGLTAGLTGGAAAWAAAALPPELSALFDAATTTTTTGGAAAGAAAGAAGARSGGGAAAAAPRPASPSKSSSPTKGAAGRGGKRTAAAGAAAAGAEDDLAAAPGELDLASQPAASPGEWGWFDQSSAGIHMSV
jgi:hypothetical protein